jgi:hypothetical protein
MIDGDDDFMDLEAPPTSILPTTMLPLIHKSPLAIEKYWNWNDVHPQMFSFHKYTHKYIVIGIIAIVTWLLY